MEIGMTSIPLDTARTHNDMHIMKILLMTTGIAVSSLLAFPILSDSAIASIKIPDASGAMDACLDSGYSYQYCRQILGSPDPGNICGPLEAAGLNCPIQR
jgi:hypothetical protein